LEKLGLRQDYDKKVVLLKLAKERNEKALLPLIESIK